MGPNIIRAVAYYDILENTFGQGPDISFFILFTSAQVPDPIIGIGITGFKVGYL